MKTIDQKMKTIGAKRRKKIKARAAALIAEEMTLQELRQARKLTQVRMAKALGITQDGVSPPSNYVGELPNSHGRTLTDKLYTIHGIRTPLNNSIDMK
jgi:predicted transcriptional regulator